MNKHKRRLRRISTAIAVVALAAAATSASAAQAAIWHHNGGPLTGQLDLTTYPGVGTFEMKLTSVNPVHITCQAPSTYGRTARAREETKFETATLISGCKTYVNGTNEHVKDCDQIGQSSINLKGTGEKVATNSEYEVQKIIFGENCVLGYSLRPVITSMTLEWPWDVVHPKIGIEHEAKGSGVGTLGNKTMTVTYTNNYQRYAPEGDTWGWY